MAPPALAPHRSALAGELSTYRHRGERVALVPTMGALHDGHVSLIRAARDLVGPYGAVVVSIFVNPLQFGAGEDLDRYPRTPEDDLRLCAREGVDVVFAPNVAEVYPGGEPSVTVDPGPLGRVLEGASRPTHFRGVLTVVAKLFGLVTPDVAVFGEKDYQQLALIRTMAEDLCLGVEVIGAPTLRESDGLAMSSRNRYLDPAQRAAAVALSEALNAAVAAAPAGVEAARRAGLAVVDAEPGVELDYLAITEADLSEVRPEDPMGRTGRVLIAARLGATRLIDNAALPLLGGPAPTTLRLDDHYELDRPHDEVHS